MCGVGLATVALGLGASLPALAADGAEAPPGFIAGERVNAAWDKLRFAGTQSADAYPLPGGIALPLDPPAVLETPGTFTQDGALEMVAVTDPDALEADVAACTYYREGSAK